MIDLAPHHLETVQDLLGKFVPDYEVRAYGSRVTWTANEYSDLDLVVVGESTLPQGTLPRLRDVFEESNLPMRVDVLDWHRIPQSFRDVIDRDHIVLGGPARLRGLPKGWRTIPFADAVVINPKVPLKRGQPFPFVSMADVDPTMWCVRAQSERRYQGSGSRFEVGDTLMARITPCLENGKIARYCAAEGDPRPAVGSTEFITVRGRASVTDDTFAYYLTRSDRVRNYAIGQMTGTSGRQRVPVASLAHCLVSVPPLSEQRAIAHILGTLDEKIDLNRRMCTTLDRVARSLFRSWFVDFQPVRAKTRGRPTGLPPALDAQFPSSFAESEIGEIPEGWEVRPLSDLIEVNPRRMIGRGVMATYVGMAALPTSGPHVSVWARRPFKSGSRFAQGDTLLARITPSLENGKTAIVDFLDDSEIAWGSTEFIVLRPKPPWPHEMAYLIAREPQFREYAITNMTGTSGRQRVPPGAVATYPIAAPPSSIAAAFSGLIRPLFQYTTGLTRQSLAMAKHRDVLLPKLLSGVLRVSHSSIGTTQ